MLLSIASKILFRELLNRMKGAVDTKRRDEQTEFRKGRSCTDHIATLRIIVEHSVELQSSVYIYVLWIFKRSSTVSIEKRCGSCFDIKCMVILQRFLTSESSMKDFQHKLSTMADKQKNFRCWLAWDRDICFPPSAPYSLWLSDKRGIWVIRQIKACDGIW